VSLMGWELRSGAAVAPAGIGDGEENQRFGGYRRPGPPVGVTGV
jgi:hypothetical protein